MYNINTMNCTNPSAVNYDPTAVSDDGSCIYLKRIDGVCYAFQDLAPNQVVDQSYTLSFSMRGANWVFFHDYLADMYFSTRNKLFSLKDNKIFEHNAGPFGKYYTNDTKSFLVDVVFNGAGEGTLDTVEWITEVLNNNETRSRQETLTHITIWNSTQCTGRIPVSTIFKDLEYETSRETAGKWSFDHFRDKVKSSGLQFLQDIFHNFAIDSGALSDSIPWFEQQLLEDNYFVVRFEFDNISGKQLFLHDVGAQVTPSYR
jgi:hypothetical protein